MQRNSSDHNANAEIDLRELIMAFWEGKWIVIISVSVCLLAALAYLSLFPQTLKGNLHVSTLGQAEMNKYAELNRTNIFQVEADDLRQRLISELAKQGARLPSLSSVIVVGDSVSFETKVPDIAINEWHQAVDASNDVVAESLKAESQFNFQNEQQNHLLKLNNLIQKNESLIHRYNLQMSQRVVMLKEQLVLAETAGIEVGSEQLVANAPLYLRGYKVLSKMVDQIQAREPLQHYIPELVELEIERKGMENRDFEKDKKVINGAPFYASDFSAAEVHLDLITFQKKLKPSIVLVLSFVLGGMFGVVILIIRNILRK